MQVADLKIEEDIVPFFDNYLNIYGKTALSQIFSYVPESEQEVLDTQAIVKTLIQFEHALSSLPNYNQDLAEVYSFTNQLSNNTGLLNESNIRLRLKHTINRSVRDSFRSKVLQWGFLIDKLYQNCFKLIKPELFPDIYRSRFLQINNVILAFRPYFTNNDIFSSAKGTSNYIDILKKLLVIANDGTFTKFWSSLFQFYAYASIAGTTRSRKFQFAEMSNQELLLKHFYHPLLRHPVRNDLVLNKRLLLLTGPNMSGKSTLLKSLSLCVFLSRIGIAVPAASCRIPWYDEIYVHINKKDSLVKGVSHFMDEINLLKTAVENAANGKKVFAVFDEIFSGTNIDDAHSLLETTIRGVQKFQDSCFIFSTHLDCSSMAALNDGHSAAVFHLDANISNGHPTFHYKLKEGFSDQRLGKLIFEQSGLSTLLSGK